MIRRIASDWFVGWLQSGFRQILTIAFVWICVGGIYPAFAGQASVRKVDKQWLTPTIQVGHQALPPLAYVRFCIQHSRQCSNVNAKRNIDFSAKAEFREIQRVNLAVNEEITPLKDAIFQGISDKWSVDVSQGDCEEYAIIKRKRLLEHGWPSGNLRIAIALTKGGIGHAVLIVRLQGTDYVLDNMRNSIRPWHETGYKFIKIQSKYDPKDWLYIKNRDQGAVANF